MAWLNGYNSKWSCGEDWVSAGDNSGQASHLNGASSGGLTGRRSAARLASSDNKAQGARGSE